MGCFWGYNARGVACQMKSNPTWYASLSLILHFSRRSRTTSGLNFYLPCGFRGCGGVSSELPSGVSLRKWPLHSRGDKGARHQGKSLPTCLWWEPRAWKLKESPSSDSRSPSRRRCAGVFLGSADSWAGKFLGLGRTVLCI